MTLLWIVLSGLAMAALALVGVVTLSLRPEKLQRVLLPLVAFSAGSLLGGALFHMLPAAIDAVGNTTAVWTSLAAGFLVFFLLEQFLHWHHCQQAADEHARGLAPTGGLILLADGLHNLIGGLSVGAAFVLDLRLGWIAWIAAAAHEIPQELGDFGVLVRSGASPRRALLLNVLSALTFPVGGVIAWFASSSIDVTLLVPFAAGNFLYIAAADLIPEVKKSEHLKTAAVHFLCLAAGIALLLLLRAAFSPHGAAG